MHGRDTTEVRAGDLTLDTPYSRNTTLLALVCWLF
jgi:hypothetical protein